MQAKDIMTTNLATVGPDQSIVDVIRCMLERNASGIPVLDANGKLLGIITEGDLLRRGEIGTTVKRSNLLAFLLGSGRLAGEYVHSHTRAVQDIMTAPVVTVDADTELADVVAIMEQHRVKRVPVVSGDRCVGIVSRADVVRAVGNAIEAAARNLASDDASVRARILDEMGKTDWCRGNRIDVSVENGVATLDGIIFDERERQAILVLVGNVSGVKRCVDHITWVEPNTGMSYSPGENVPVPPVV